MKKISVSHGVRIANVQANANNLEQINQTSGKIQIVRGIAKVGTLKLNKK